jgi:hypothetical protein
LKFQFAFKTGFKSQERGLKLLPSTESEDTQWGSCLPAQGPWQLVTATWRLGGVFALFVLIARRIHEAEK